MNIIIVGIGGNGQTYFMKYLREKSFPTNHIHDADNLKHNPCPTNLTEEQKKSKIIYVYNKIFDSICSHCRRGWGYAQMVKININNQCDKGKLEDFFKLTESTNIDHFGAKDHFLRWYNYDFSNGIYFLNLDKINKYELSKFLECDKSVFDNLNFDSKNRHNYDEIKSKYPLSNTMYTDIDNFINKLSMDKNKNI